MVAPLEFIPLAEETGLIVPVGRRMLAEACAQAVRWPGAPGRPAPSVSVNLSARQLHDPDLVAEFGVLPPDHRVCAAEFRDPAYHRGINCSTRSDT